MLVLAEAAIVGSVQLVAEAVTKFSKSSLM
jgi:hypothetical protein